MRLLSIILLALSLAGCAMKNPSFVNQEPMRVQNEVVAHHFDSNQVSKSDLDAVADDIKRRAESPVTIHVNYALTPPLHNAQRLAEAQGQRVKSYLQKQGVRRSIVVALDPIEEGPLNTIDITYDALQAMAPSDCGNIGLADADQYAHEHDSNYRYGCSQDRYLSMMIARPGDLLGNDTTSPAESVAQGKSLDLYRSGQPQTPPEQQNLSASKVYQP